MKHSSCYFRSLTILFLIFHSPFFLGSEQAPNEKKIEILIPDGSSEESNWGKDSLQFEDLDLLGDASEENSKNFLEKAKESFLNSVDRFKKTNDLVNAKRKEFDQRIFEADRYEWQRKNRRENFERSLARDLNKSRSDCIHLLVFSMNSLEKIQNPKVKDTETFRDLQANIYREYIKHQLALKNFLQAMDLLERYIQIGNKYYEDPEAQGFLANCYERAYRLSKKNRDDQAREKFDILRKKHGLLYAEFKFGKNSADYQEFSKELFKD
ncbi:hypothetical protein LEP1GSC161_3300 [Leptospira santarosai str. CBC1416]|uniref:Tetratricopeptide repeat protein n=3 Tax=Leptospira santarosai TaxID=28183 RepID=M6UKG7_9LEPT|nr:hypothetical protein [Leptospira santarosai]EMO58327.1 hypothetical protein LEP1GSC161_3300 [Leptospira santarosai str. CBC1416]EKO34353.1 hypothetical protein LEP1GSC179_1826 [Leptospira santarosai str. MOR084]EKR93155.1 hypothetical protein LEP1GSC163_1062 [Leptospira santarosai str. CBC379]EKS07143.1 hypothetical protein LEP1GSC071_0825 [Leptospira santarosai str. JET]EMJ46742.1 hypothetical protein LEP1GSC169_0779 [Leptospira santarosai str. HAI1349]